LSDKTPGERMYTLYILSTAQHAGTKLVGLATDDS